MSTTLRVDQLAREFWNRCAIAVGMSDTDAALECCRHAGEIELAYELRLKTGESPSAPGEAAGHRGGSSELRPSPLRRITARFAGTCRKCSRGITVGSSIAYDPDAKRAFHAECSP